MMEKEFDRDLPLKKQISENIEALRKLKDFTLIKLSEESGISKSTLSDYKNCKTLISPGNVEKLAEVFNVPKSAIDPSFKSKGISNLIPVEPNFVKIPILGVIACGDPILATENIEGYTYEFAEYLPSGEIFALKAKGDSMEPTIMNGSKVLVRAQSDVENGEIAAVLVNGDEEATLKRVKKQDGIVLLMPDNNSYEPIVVSPSNPARIIGKVIRAIMDFD
ncbi:XRE family transcriptional regulator [Lysinibacillus sp. 1 U-2021]|uniref:LexA family protein n=1 Tax=Lysinibacillus sp. 1 U-2021 TaxID=3039426 RepID=UPI00248131E9|nr:XRE family transcriptional regulator [Lysinibacillus sp. 1 U-2021]WGT38540.1 XRE family transcriptional regulator [Lysinibacillus sp. 1 U-2021]